MVTLNGDHVPPDGLDIARAAADWLQEHPQDTATLQALHTIINGSGASVLDQPDDIMPTVPPLADYPVAPGLKEYVGAIRSIAGCSIPTAAACVGAAFNLLCAEDVDCQSLAHNPHPTSLYFVVGSESGWRKSSAFREAMGGHIEADERVEATHQEGKADLQGGEMEQKKGFSPRALRQDFTIEALLSRLWKARRTMAVANSDASSLLGGWSFRNDNLGRTLSHFITLWDGDASTIDRRNPDMPELYFYQRRLTGLFMAQVDVAEALLFSTAAGNGFTARCLASIDRCRPSMGDDGPSQESALSTIIRMRNLIISRREQQDAQVELLRGATSRPVIRPEAGARDLLAAMSGKCEVLADNADTPHERGFWARAQEQTARYAAMLAYVRTIEERGDGNWDSINYIRAEVDAAQAVITWHGELIRAHSLAAASEKGTKMARESIAVLRERMPKHRKDDGSVGVRDLLSKFGKGEVRINAMLREDVIRVLEQHRQIIPTARKGHYLIAGVSP